MDTEGGSETVGKVAGDAYHSSPSTQDAEEKDAKTAAREEKRKSNSDVASTAW